MAYTCRSCTVTGRILWSLSYFVTHILNASVVQQGRSAHRTQDFAGRGAKVAGRGFAASPSVLKGAGGQGGAEDGRGGVEAAPLALRLSGQLLLGVVRVSFF